MSPTEPPVYRWFAVLAFASTLAVGTPAGLAMLWWLYAGGPAVTFEARLLHAHAQTFGLFATLILGVAPHLVARFTGRPTTAPRAASLMLGAMTGGLVLRIAGVAALSPPTLLAAGLCETAALVLFAIWLARALDPPPLALVRRHLLVATAWLIAASGLEVGLRALALGTGQPAPGASAMQVAETMALVGGVLGWMLGVLLRAGPMFVASWQVPRRAALAVPVALAVAIAMSGIAQIELVSGRAHDVLARLGDALAAGTFVGVAGLSGAWRRAGPHLPLVARSAAEARLFRVTLASAAAAVIASVAGAIAAAFGTPIPRLDDAVRHLITVGVLGGVVAAMTFRLIPVLEAARLPWPWLREVALGALVASVALRSAEVLVSRRAGALAPLVALSGVLAWLVFAAPFANLAGILVRRARTVRAP